MDLSLRHIILVGLALISQAALAYNVKGHIKDTEGNPEGFATLRLYLLPDTIHPGASGVSDEEGAFRIQLPDSGGWRLNIMQFGKEEFNCDIAVSEDYPTCDVGEIILKPADTQLQEVTVTAQRPLVVKEIDRIGYDVQADDEAKTSQLDEILKKVPLVSVDPDGTIKIKGSTDFKIYKNGRPNNSFTRNAKDIFKALPASMIKKIEVITDPGAREDAEGTTAILNIVTLENTIIKGIMGSVSLDYERCADVPGATLWLQTQIDKFNLSAYGGYNNMSRKRNMQKSESLQKYTDSGNELFSTREGSSHGDLGYFGLEGSLEIDSLNLVTAEFGGYIYGSKADFLGTNLMKDANGTKLYSYNTKMNYSPNRYFDLNGNVNYQHSTRRKGETITLSYLISSTDQRQHQISEYEDGVNMPVPYTGTSNDFTLNFLEQTAQADWTRPINTLNTLDVGAKYIHRNNHSVNDIDYFDYQQTHSDFTHLTQVLALYADWRLKWKSFGARAGLRYEWSHLSAKYHDGSNSPFSSNLSDLVPNAAVSYNLGVAHSFKLSYSTRIQRPGISQLNPAKVESPTSISSGNPDLGSTRIQSVALNYNLILQKIQIDASASYRFSNNNVVQVREFLPGDITKSTYANAGRNNYWTFGLWANYSPWQKTSFMVNLTTSRVHASNPSLNIESCGWGTSAYLRVRRQLPRDFSVTGYMSVFHSSPGLYNDSPFHFADNSYWGLNIQKQMLKEKRLTISIGITNPFGKRARLYENTPINSGYTGYDRSWTRNAANNFSISVSYRFGRLNAQVKKTAKSISNDDLENHRN